MPRLIFSQAGTVEQQKNIEKQLRNNKNIEKQKIVSHNNYVEMSQPIEYKFNIYIFVLFSYRFIFFKLYLKKSLQIVPTVSKNAF